MTPTRHAAPHDNASLDEWANRIYGTNYENLAPGQMSRIQREAFGNENGPTKFSNWQLPGGENYR
ncbi:MAG: hypothetical protein NWQ51_00835, partial [OM182 bacterium]|nr:hypothetical protein [OM182 bacterium]